jgi:lipoprotein-anchoring transpeptidase ErfK/SrfK
MRRGRHIQKRRLRAIAVVMAAVVAVGLLAAGGGAYAAYRYEQARADRILPGVRVAGVDVGGLTRAEAQRAVKAQTSKTLKAQLAIHVGDTRWIVTPSELGRRADIESAVDAALASSRSMGTFDRFWHRFRDEPVNVSIDVEYATKGDAVEELLARIAKDVWVPPTPASMGINDDATDIVTHRARPGEKLDVARATETVSQAIVDGRSSLRLPTRIVRPKLTAATMGKTIVVWVDRNKLELYDGFEVEETWDVATAKPGWTTPVGVWNIWDKRENPAWYNPALDSWGAGLPAVVPGGPGNPMGTRAIYIDAPGLIRIHGTTDPSSVGRYASHGCIRMHNEQIEDLFERIEVGDNVIIVGHRPAGAAYWDTPAASDI